MTWKKTLSYLIVLLLGFVIGCVLPESVESPHDVEVVNADKPRSARRMPTKASLGSPSRSQGRGGARDMLVLESGLLGSEDQGALVVVPASLLDAMSEAKGRASLTQDLFSRDGKLEAYLQITDKEKSGVQHAWRKLQSDVRGLEKQLMRAEDLADGSVRITIPDLANEVKKLGSDFKARAHDLLGYNRAEAFLAIKQIGTQFSSIEGERIYTVRTETVGNGRWRYHMSEVGLGGRTWVGETVPTAIRHITDAARINPNLNPPVLEDGDE